MGYYTRSIETYLFYARSRALVRDNYSFDLMQQLRVYRC
jgi:hypothetical protein